jgi:hypothetical protein
MCHFKKCFYIYNDTFPLFISSLFFHKKSHSTIKQILVFKNKKIKHNKNSIPTNSLALKYINIYYVKPLNNLIEITYIKKLEHLFA